MTRNCRLSSWTARAAITAPTPAGCVYPHEMFDAFASSADALQAWYDGGRQGERPPGRLRQLRRLHLSPATRAWAGPLYRVIHDPDGRPRALRRQHAF